MLAGTNAPSPQGGDDSSSGRIPGSGSPYGSQAGSQSPQGGSADAKLNNDVQTLRSAEASILEMAQSYTTASKALRTASDAIRAAQRQIASSPGTAEPPVPNTNA